MIARQCCEFPENKSVKCQLRQQSQPFWYQGPVAGEDSFHRWGGGWFWSDFKHIAFIMHFIIITCPTPDHQTFDPEGWGPLSWEIHWNSCDYLTTNTRHLFQVCRTSSANYKNGSSESSDSGLRTVVLYLKKEIKNLKATTLVHQHGPVRYYIKW